MKSGKVLTLVLQCFITVMQALLGLRILFKLVSASEGSFVQWVYLLSDPLVIPFSGSFPPTMVSAMFYVDVAAILAMILYTLVGYLLLRIVAGSRKKDRSKYLS
ncbi:hypothetical protein GCM10008986_15550 [Salinibacillus aidingensis]|uniref:YGGT family protein n=1 Tax=Salinibacillus aidingensis TaxID=237684 RepID=A0ABN1B608_9BACI